MGFASCGLIKQALLSAYLCYTGLGYTSLISVQVRASRLKR